MGAGTRAKSGEVPVNIRGLFSRGRVMSYSWRRNRERGYIGTTKGWEKCKPSRYFIVVVMCGPFAAKIAAKASTVMGNGEMVAIRRR